MLGAEGTRPCAEVGRAGGGLGAAGVPSPADLGVRAALRKPFLVKPDPVSRCRRAGHRC